MLRPTEVQYSIPRLSMLANSAVAYYRTRTVSNEHYGNTLLHKLIGCTLQLFYVPLRSAIASVVIGHYIDAQVLHKANVSVMHCTKISGISMAVQYSVARTSTAVAGHHYLAFAFRCDQCYLQPTERPWLYMQGNSALSRWIRSGFR
jgi:hypothetical protein